MIAIFMEGSIVMEAHLMDGLFHGRSEKQMDEDWGGSHHPRHLKLGCVGSPW